MTADPAQLALFAAGHSARPGIAPGCDRDALRPGGRRDSLSPPAPGTKPDLEPRLE
jgi:hypothetical protein